MKKEPIVYFPEGVGNPTKPLARVGQILRLGKPSMRYYEHVYHSLNHSDHSLRNLQELVNLEGLTVKIISILKMRSGDSVAVIHRKDGKKFSTNIEKLFTHIDKALETKELNFN
jgi:hypothetical protein